jgi:hypothetical protein
MNSFGIELAFVAAATAVHFISEQRGLSPQLFVGVSADPESKLLTPEDAENLRTRSAFSMAAIPWGEAVVEVSKAYPEHLRHLREMPAPGRVLCIVSMNGQFLTRLMPDTFAGLTAGSKGRVG